MNVALYPFRGWDIDHRVLRRIMGGGEVWDIMGGKG
jgi:hypothetical protein